MTVHVSLVADALAAMASTVADGEVRPTRAQRRSAVAYRLARVEGARLQGVPVDRVQVMWEPSGRPTFGPGSARSFSVSHSGELIAVALCDSDVGVDVQLRRPVRPGLVVRYFTEAVSDAKSRDGFDAIDLWACAESAAKLLGADSRDFSGRTG